MFYLTIVFLSSNLILLISGNVTKTLYPLTVQIKHEEKDTFSLYYNLTTNHSYYLTIRLFEHKQIKFGLFSSAYQYQQRSIKIFNQYNISKESFYLFIICFYFILSLNDIDIQCKDIRLLKDDNRKYNHEQNASYKPLFVLLMYGLSILVLLPVIAQHRRRKKAVLIERQKVLKHYSPSITANDSNILSQMTKNRSMNLKNIPTEIEFSSLQSIKTIIEDIDENDRFKFSVSTLDTLTNRPVGDDYDDDDDEEFEVTADDCIAHLLNNTPWNTSLNKKISKINSRRTNYSNQLEEQYIPMIATSYANETQRSISNSNVLCKKGSFNIDPTFIESGV